MKDLNSMRLTFPSHSVNEGFARSAVAGFAAQLDPTLEELGDIKTAVSEAVTNCIVHAYPDTVGDVTLSCSIREGGVLEVRVRDRGCGIADVKAARAPMYTTGGPDRSGMGFTIMESFMDEVEISSVVGIGTKVIMKKQIKKEEKDEIIKEENALVN